MVRVRDLLVTGLLLLASARARADEAGTVVVVPRVIVPAPGPGSGAAEVPVAELWLPPSPELVLSASPGTLLVPEAAEGRRVARYRPPPERAPGAVLVHAALAGGAPCSGRFAVVQRGSHAVHTIRTKPGSTVRIAVGGRPASTAVADAAGLASVRTLIFAADRDYEVTAVDALGNQSTRRLELPPLPAEPALLAIACRPEVAAGEGVLVQVAAVDALGRALAGELEGPAGVAIAPEGQIGMVRWFRVAPPAQMAPGPLVLWARSGATRREVALRVTSAAAPPSFVEPRPELAVAHRPPAPPSSLRLAAEAGAGSNLGDRVGLSAALGLDYCIGALDGRLRPRLGLSLLSLWGGGAAPARVLAAPLELGLGASLLGAGRFSVELELGAGAAWSVVDGEPGGATPTSRSERLLPSLSGSLVLRLAVGRGGLTLRATWRQLFTGDGPSEAEAADRRGLMALSLGGDLGLTRAPATAASAPR